MSESFLNGKVTLLRGDCLELLPTLEENSIDSCVTDPPYHLSSIVKRFGAENAAPAQVGKTGAYERSSRGFMGKQWDGGDIAFQSVVWQHVFRVLKPGAYLVAFGGSRTFHRMACAIEVAGFDIRDSIWYLYGGGPLLWGYGSGFPKSHNVSQKLNAVRCLCGVRQGAPSETASPAVEVLQPNVCGPSQTNLTEDKNVRRVRSGVGTSDSRSSRTEQDMLTPVRGPERECEQGGGNTKATDNVRLLRGNGKRPAAVEAQETNSGVLQPVMPSAGGNRAASYPTLSQGAGRLDGGEHGELPDQDDGTKEPGMEGGSDLSEPSRKLREREIRPLPARSSPNGEARRLCDGASASNGADNETLPDPDGVRASYRPPAAQQSPEQSGTVAGQPEPQVSGTWPLCSGCGKPVIPDGLGTALKPAVEPIVLARKPLSESSIAANVLRHGTGGINIDGCRIETSESLNGGAYAEVGGRGESQSLHGGSGMNVAGKTVGKSFEQPNGRWPANLIHDGSEEVVRGFPETQNGGQNETSIKGDGMFMAGSRDGGTSSFAGDSGSAARFFYTAKADSDDRLGSRHPTVKPLDLIQYLIRLVTPKGGLVLDPFAGTGTAGEAAWREGAAAILIEREPEYQADIVRRMNLCLAGPDERARESIKASGKVGDAGPLFGGAP